MLFSESGLNQFSEDGVHILRSSLRVLIPLVRVNSGTDTFLQNLLALKNLVSYLANFGEEIELLMNALRVIHLVVSQRTKQV